VSVVSDEVLMAYADGALEPAARNAVELVLQNHPEYREKIEKFRATAAPLQEVFRDTTSIDHLQPLIDRIRRSDLGPTLASVRAAEVRRLPQSRMLPGRRPPAQQPYRMALAASVALLFGAALGWLLQPGNASSVPSAGLIRVSDGSLMAHGALQDLLEKSGRGVPVTAQLGGGKTWELEASFSFPSIGQQPCRRYELRNPAREHFAGYACRGQGGQWMVQAHAKLEASPTNGPSGYWPASGPSGDAADAAIEAAIRAASAGRVYPEAEEKALIAHGWIP
jgi:hypothetical protein